MNTTKTTPVNPADPSNPFRRSDLSAGVAIDPAAKEATAIQVQVNAADAAAKAKADAKAKAEADAKAKVDAEAAAKAAGEAKPKFGNDPVTELEKQYKK